MLDKPASVFCVVHNPPFLDVADDDKVDRTGSIQPDVAEHLRSSSLAVTLTYQRKSTNSTTSPISQQQMEAHVRGLSHISIDSRSEPTYL
jgi:hypothetical protein